MNFHTTERLGETRHRTPEGFLLIKGTPIARTGIQLYGPGETDVEPDHSGVVKIHRKPEEVFSATTMDSLNGKPFTDDHPAGLVNPKNFRQHVRGVLMNVRRGTGDLKDMLVGDVMVQDEDTIRQIEDGKVELSCGYTADYYELSPGVGEQRNIIGNHLALVDRGRCGSRCSIGDHAHTTLETNDMAKNTYLSQMLKLFGAKDAAELQVKLAAEIPTTDGAVAALESGDGTHIHIHQGSKKTEDGATEDAAPAWFKTFADASEARFAAIEKLVADAKAKDDKEDGDGDDDDKEDELAEEAPAGTEDKARVAKDSVYLVDSWQATIAAAEIMLPGIRVPTMDRAAAPKSTFDALCGFRRKTLDTFNLTADGRLMLQELQGGKELDTKSMTCDRVRTLFLGAAAAKRQKNNAAGGAAAGAHQPAKPVGIRTIADLNAFAAKRYTKPTV